MLVNLIVDSIDAKVLARAKVSSFHTDVGVKGAGFTDSTMTVNFKWSVMYAENIAYVTLEGRAVFAESPEKIKAIIREWDAKKTIPKDYISQMSNEINYFCVVNAALITRPMDIAPPIVLPNIVLSAENKR